jgi:hypothetical protein
MSTVKRGWLTKRGELVRNWKLRWFVLEGAALTYYKSDLLAAGGVPQGAVDLASVSAVGPCSDSEVEGQVR